MLSHALNGLGRGENGAVEPHGHKLSPRPGYTTKVFRGTGVLSCPGPSIRRGEDGAIEPHDDKL